MEKLTFAVSEDETVTFFVLEQTRINNMNYLLVTDSEEDEADAYILKDVSGPSDTEAVYEMVEDETELESVAKVFAEEVSDIATLA